jgi:uncharacterized protein (DUF1800 family)
MSHRVLLATVVVGLSAFPVVTAFATHSTADPARLFRTSLSSDQKILQALNRLTFGPRPGDIQQVKALGLKKWIDRQLHPETIPESPVLVEKLKTLDSLSMSSADMVENYPSPQVVKLMLDGRIPFPTDPDRKLLLAKMVEKYQKRIAAGADPAAATAFTPDVKAVSELLTPAEIRSLRTGTPEQRLQAFLAVPKAKQDDVIAAMPGVRLAIFPVAAPELRRRLEMASGPQQVVARDLAEGKLFRAVYSNRQLDEVLTDFWFNHFNIYLDKGADRYLVTAYERDVIRPHVLGKFKELLEATAKSPAMLFYLDNWQSAGPNAPSARGKKAATRGLNENYGRELLELHTLGVDGGYTQKDVTEAARCFTGWTILQPERGGGFTFNARLHDDGEKTVLRVTIPAGGGQTDGEKVLDIVAHSPATAHFISKKLAMRFVADEPPAALVDRMAETFRKTDGDLRAVMQTMLQSKEFWSEGAYLAKLKSPLEFVASAVRAVQGQIDYASPLAEQVGQLGEPLYRKQEPTGYSNSGREWLNSGGLIARMNFAVQLGDDKMPGVKVDPTQSAGIGLGSPDFQKR